MKKSNGQKRVQKHSAKKRGQANAKAPVNRRSLLRSFRNVMILTAAAGGIGSYAYSAYQEDVAERDLSKIGKGRPAIVQVHDPNCSSCAELQKNVRNALNKFSDENHEYLVANIATPEGRAFANRHAVPHVTLLLFDGAGRLRQILQGVRDETELVSIFETLIKDG